MFLLFLVGMKIYMIVMLVLSRAQRMSFYMTTGNHKKGMGREDDIPLLMVTVSPRLCDIGNIN